MNSLLEGVPIVKGLLTKNISDRLESLFFPQGRVFLSIKPGPAANVYLFCNQAEGGKQELKKTYFPLEQ